MLEAYLTYQEKFKLPTPRRDLPSMLSLTRHVGGDQTIRDPIASKSKVSLPGYM